MEIRRLFDIPYHQQKNSPLKQSLGGMHVNGKNYSYSTDEFVKLVNKVSLGLLQMGVKPGDKIALISYNNRPEWNIMDKYPRAKALGWIMSILRSNNVPENEIKKEKCEEWR